MAVSVLDDRRLSLTNNIVHDFALRRQSLVSLNRVFGIGEAGQTTTSPDASTREPHQRRRSIQKPSVGESDKTPYARHGFSLARMAEEKRARKVRFYRNGDRFFRGMVIAVSTQRFRTFESLLNSLTMSTLCDKKIMPCGVRHIFTVDGNKRVASLDQLEDGQSYVCASTDVFRTLDYSRNESPVWNREVTTNGLTNHKLTHSQLQQQYLQHQRQQQQQQQPDRMDMSGYTTPSQHSCIHKGTDDNRPPSAKLKFSKSEMTPTEKATYEDYMRSFVVPRLITVVRYGKKPRKSVRLLLNSKTAKTIEQVLEDIAASIKLDCGVVKKLYALSGRRVTCLRDFFEEDSVFLACGTEKPSPEDFILDSREVRQVFAYRLHNAPGTKSRVTLRAVTRSATAKASRTKTIGGQTSSPRSTTISSTRSCSTDKIGEQETPATDDTNEESPKIPMPLTLTNKYEIGGVIGTGNFAVVFECKERKSKKKYALKIVNKDSCKDREKMIDNEVRILRRLNHPNIIRLVEDYAFQQRVFYVMDLVKGGDLFDAICSSRKYTEQDAGSIVFNLASALDYLHSLKIVHRDVKPENILIRLFDDGTKSLKLGDFGLATEVKGPLHAVCGTPSYVAPEIISESGYNTKVDIWSMGVITYILLSGFPPFVSHDEDQEELFDLILTGTVDFPSPFWDCVNSSAKELILCMLDKDQTTRYSARSVLEHTWIVEDTACNEDLHTTVSSGLTTNFRRSTQSIKHRGLHLMANTAMDKGNRFFRGRGVRREH